MQHISGMMTAHPLHLLSFYVFRESLMKIIHTSDDKRDNAICAVLLDSQVQTEFRLLNYITPRT